MLKPPKRGGSGASQGEGGGASTLPNLPHDEVAIFDFMTSDTINKLPPTQNTPALQAISFIVYYHYHYHY